LFQPAQAIATALHSNHCLTHLHLSINAINEEGAKAIATPLHSNHCLTHLNLHNSINEEGAKAIAMALHSNHCLTHLHLSINSINEEGAKAIATALHSNHCLTHLDLPYWEMASSMSLALFLVTSACAVLPAFGHGRMTQPVPRSQNDNGAVAGGPGTVHEFSADKQTKYQHGICGNAVGSDQTYNMVGNVAATYGEGSTIEIKVTITAHHVGYFEFDFCDNAGELSEDCLAKHHLLRAGCNCSCRGDTSNSCSECNECCWFWKAPMQGEFAQSVTAGYAGPTLLGIAHQPQPYAPRPYQQLDQTGGRQGYSHGIAHQPQPHAPRPYQQLDQKGGRQGYSHHSTASLRTAS
jgi:hypothetical protein